RSCLRSTRRSRVSRAHTGLLPRDPRQRTIIRVRHVALLAVLAALTVGPSGASGAHLPGVKTPSRNITCFFIPGWPTDHGVLLCRIKVARYLDRLETSCIDGPGLDWRGFALPWSGKAQVFCAGGIMHDPFDKLMFSVVGYGKTWHSAPFTCTLQNSGLTCVNASGHGLFMSRRSWRVW